MTSAPTASIIDKIKLALAKLLGNRYAVVVTTVDRAVTAFGLVFVTKLVGGDLFSVHMLLTASWWSTTASAALLAALSVVKSTVMAAITGAPALLALVSSTIRAQFRGVFAQRPQHAVPLRPPAH